MYEDTRANGPDFLASVAQQQLADGLETNATEFRVRASEWQRDQATIEHLRNQVDNLESRLSAARLALVGG